MAFIVRSRRRRTPRGAMDALIPSRPIVRDGRAPVWITNPSRTTGLSGRFWVKFRGKSADSRCRDWTSTISNWLSIRNLFGGLVLPGLIPRSGDSAQSELRPTKRNDAAKPPQIPPL